MMGFRLTDRAVPSTSSSEDITTRPGIGWDEGWREGVGGWDGAWVGEKRMDEER